MKALLIESTKSIIRRYPDKKSCVIYSGGVDTGALMESLHELHKNGETNLPKIAITIVIDDNAPDLAWVKQGIKRYSTSSSSFIEHHHIEIIGNCSDLAKSETEFVVDSLNSFDTMQVRNTLVISKAYRIAKEKYGCDLMLTGDGADELLGGYSFTWQSQDDKWSIERYKMCSDWYFAGHDIAKHLNVISASPFTELPFKEYCLNNAVKSDCIGVRMIKLSPGDEPKEHMTGKICLREAFENNVSAWRRKDPIEIGSGATVLSDPKFWEIEAINMFQLHENKGKEGVIAENSENSEASTSKVIKKDIDDVMIELTKEFKLKLRSKEHLYYFQYFLKNLERRGISFSPVLEEDEEDKSDEQKMRIKRYETTSQNGNCIECGCELHNERTNFCRICGAYPARPSM